MKDGYLDIVKDKRAIILAAVILVFVVWYGLWLWNRSEPPPDLPETWLSEFIRAVPSDMGVGVDYLLFANYEAARVEAGATDFKGFDTFLASGSIPWTYGMLGNSPIFSGYPYSETMKLDALELDQGIWTPGYHFTITTGGLEEPQSFHTRMGEAGYQIAFHRGILYLYFWRDSPPPLREMENYPMGSKILNINSVALIEDRLAVAQRVERIERLIAVHDGKVSSLWDKQSWRVLTQSVGDEFLAGALIPPEYVVSRTATGISGFERSGEQRLDDWKRYVDAWGTLERYTALVLGYSVRDGVERTAIAMYHPDPDSAERNAEELKKRWESASLDLRRFSDSDIPFSELCAPLETRIERYAESSILIADCRRLERPKTSLLGFWISPINYHELHFLVPDLSGLAAE